MKNIILLSCLLMCFACNKNENGPHFERNYVGEAQALMNGAPWEGGILAQATDTTIFGFTIHSASPQGYDRGLMDFGYLPITVNQKTILRHLPWDSEETYPESGFRTLLDDGDVLGDLFKLNNDTTNNYLEVTKYDLDKCKVEGNFSVTFVFDDRIRSHQIDDSVPDTLVFTDGRFSIKYDN